MPIVRKILLGMAGMALIFFLFATAFDVSLIRVLGSPAPIKQILSDSGIYNSVVSSSLDQAKQITTSSGEVSLSDPTIRSSADTTFSPQFLQTTTNAVIDSIYRWLDGKTARPDFRIDLSAQKTALANIVATDVEQRAANLPRCTSLPTSTNFDAFNATCLPPSVTPAEAGSIARSDILNGQGFLDNPVIDANSIKSEGSNQSIFDNQLKQTPKAYRNFKATPVVFGLIALIALLAVIFLSSPRLRGLRHAGFMLIGTGIFLILTALAINSAVNNKLLTKISLTNTVVQDDVRKLVHDAVHRVDNTLLAFGGGYAVLGVVGTGSYYLARSRQPVAKDPEDGESKPTETAVESAPKPKVKKPSSATKIKVN